MPLNSGYNGMPAKTQFVMACRSRRSSTLCVYFTFHTILNISYFSVEKNIICVNGTGFYIVFIL